MLKHKKFCPLYLFIATSFIFSCQKANDTYSVIKEDARFAYETTSEWKTNYENGEELSLAGLVVKFADKALSPITKEEDLNKSDYYFVCTNSDAPSKSCVTSFLINANVENSDLIFYLAHIDEYKGEGKETNVYVSSKLTVHIHNAKALKPWVWYVVSAVVIFAVVGMVFFTKRYKAKKEGK